MEERTMLSITIAALGDSLSDEYQFYAPYLTAAQNWPEILSSLRPSQVSLGAFSTAGQGQTRNQGYAQDWAFFGATAGGTDNVGAGTTFAEQYDGGFQPGLPGLLTQPGGISNINVVNIMIGANDYRVAIKNSVSNLLSLPSNLSTASTNIVTAVETVVPLIHAANPNTRILIDTVPPITDFPLYKNLVANLSPIVADVITGLINSSVAGVDSQITQYAQSQGAGVVDVNGLIHGFVTNPSIDGMQINPTGAGPVYTDMFLGDGRQPGTILQGVLANGIINQIDAFFPGAITPLSDAEIVQLAASAQPVTQAVLTASGANQTPGGTVVLTVQIPSFPPNYETSASPPAPNNLEPYPVPTGTVTFVDASHGNQVLATTTLNSSGAATLPATSLTAGVDTIIAVYGGDGVYPPATSNGVSVAAWTSKQAKTLRFIQTQEQQKHIQIPQTQIDQWLTSLVQGVKPQKVRNAVVKYVRSHTTKHPRAIVSGHPQAVPQFGEKKRW
jgi:hypothetical protein